MRRNNCWLAVLAVSTVLPILRNGLAGERPPVDYENVELRGNRSKAAHEARGSNQAAPSTQTNDETYPISQGMVAKQPLEASETSYFPGSKDQRRPLAKEASIPGVSTEAIPWQTSTNLDAGPSKANQLWLSPVQGSIATNTVSLRQEESKLIDGLSKEDPLERSNKFHSREQPVEATKRSFTQIPRTILASATSGLEIRGGRRLSPWISRGAIKDSSGQANDVIHRVSGSRSAGALRGEGEEAALARGKNQWGTSARVLGHPYYGHVARVSRDDGALTTTRGDAGKVVGFVENRPVDAGASGTADGDDSFSEIHARHGDIGYPASSRGEAREQTVEERSSRMDVIGVASAKGAAGRHVESAAGVFTADGKARGRTAAEFRGVDMRLRGKPNNESMRALVNGTLSSRGVVKGPEEIQGNKVSEGSPDETRTVITRETSVSMFHSKSKADRHEDSKRGSVSRKSEAARLAEGTHEPCGVPSKQRSTASNDDAAENSGFRSIQRENRAAISTSSVTIGVESVLDSTEHPASARGKGNFVGCRDTPASDTSSEGSLSRRNEEILPRKPDGSRVASAEEAGRASNNETVDGENFNSDASGEVASGVHGGKNARDTSGNRSNYTASPEGYKVPSERLIQTVAEWRSEDGEEAAIKIPPMGESTTDDATKESENAPRHSLPGSIGDKKNSTYLRRDMSSLAEGSFQEKTIDPSVSRFSGKNARGPFRNSDGRSVTKGMEGKRKYVGNSKSDVRVDRLSEKGELDSGILTLIPSKRGIGVAETVVIPEDRGERSRVNYPSNSLVEHRDAENYGERGIKFDEKLNSSPTNGPVIVFRGGGRRRQDLLNQNSRASSEEVEDNEAASGFPSRSAQAKGVHRSLNDAPPSAVNPFVHGEKNVEDHPAPTSSLNKPPQSRKGRAFRSSLVPRNPKQGSISESDTLYPNATSRSMWTNAGRSDTVPNVTSPRIDSMPRALETGIPRVSNALDRPTEFVTGLEDRSTVRSGLYETDIGAGTTSSSSDVPLRATNSSQLGVGASIVSSADDERKLGAVASVASSENDGVSLATVEDASPRNMDNSSHDLEPAGPLWPVKHSAVVEGDLVLGGLMMVHEREDTVTCGPVMPQGGVQALEAMLYTLDRLNDRGIVPGVKIGAHILDDCDKDTYGLEMAVDFIKGTWHLLAG